MRSTPDTVFIGLPTYNRPAQLDMALGALTRQTWVDLRILISDNASPNPEVADVIRAWTEMDERVRAHRQPRNQGRAANYRAAFDACDARYFMWATDDDAWAPTFVADMRKLLSAHPEAALACAGVEEASRAGAQLRRYPSFAAFASPLAGPVSRAPAAIADAAIGNAALAFAAADEADGKALMTHGLFRADALRAVVDEVWETVNFGAWRGDAALMQAVLCRHRAVSTDATLLQKRRDLVTALDFAEAAATEAEIEDYIARCRAAATPELAEAVAASMDRLRGPRRLAPVTATVEAAAPVA